MSKVTALIDYLKSEVESLLLASKQADIDHLMELDNLRCSAHIDSTREKLNSDSVLSLVRSDFEKEKMQLLTEASKVQVLADARVSALEQELNLLRQTFANSSAKYSERIRLLETGLHKIIDADDTDYGNLVKIAYSHLSGIKD